MNTTKELNTKVQKQLVFSTRSERSSKGQIFAKEINVFRILVFGINEDSRIPNAVISTRLTI